MKLIINADDFGLSKSISDGIIEGIQGGYITSTSIMINMKYAEYAVQQAIKHNINCIGLHVNLTVGKPIISNSNLTDENGVFLYNRKQIENSKLTYDDAYNEIKAQIELFNKYAKGQIILDHLNCHHHLYDNKYILKAIIDIAKELNIPVRNENQIKYKSPDYLYMEFTIKNVELSSISKMINEYKSINKTVELCTHPGYVDEYTKSVTSYIDREKELTILKQAKQKGIFDKIELINFKQI